MKVEDAGPNVGLPEHEDEIRQARPFYFVLLLVLAGVYGITLRGAPQLREPQRLIPFTGLVLLHCLLHWWSHRLPLHPRWIYPYFAFQTLTVCVISVLSAGHSAVLGLYLALAGEAVGVVEDLRKSAPLVAAILGTAAVTYGLVLGWTNLPGWLALVLPMAFFVMLYVTMFGRQMRGRQEAQRLLRELEIAHRRLSEYSARVEELTVTAERQRMARELHDTLAQGLAGLILQLEAADSHLVRGEGDRAQSIVRQAMLRARSTLADARRAIGELRAESSRPPDLGEAVRQEAERFSSATGIPCGVEIDLPEAIPDDVSENALRAITEALTNTARHAAARHAWVEVAAQGSRLSVCIRDDGSGFDPARARTEDHYGLLGLRERARLAGGLLEIRTAPGQGTSVQLTLTLPLPQPEAAP
jgi:NarL family two-component system sensor histidine kinase YdfH